MEHTVAIAVFLAVHGHGQAASAVESGQRLAPKSRDRINVAFALNHGATVIDFAGPWEVFQDVDLAKSGAKHDQRMPFRLYTVSPDGSAFRASGGLHIIPDYSVTDAPQPDIVVVPAQQTHDKMLDWLRRVSTATDLTMSVCTGAFQLGRAGLLDGLTATTHHDFYESFSGEFPLVRLIRRRRFVEHERIATAGGLTSGIDLALRVVARYFGESVGAQTADYMEYTSDDWRNSATGTKI